MANYIDNLPFDIQEIIYKKKHQMEMKDVFEALKCFDDNGHTILNKRFLMVETMIPTTTDEDFNSLQLDLELALSDDDDDDDYGYDEDENEDDWV